MKILHALVCAALLAGIAPVQAQTNTDNTHPVLQKRAPREVLNSDILALPEREREAWIHGAVAQMVTVLAGKDNVTSRCVSDWYFKVGSGSETVEPVMHRFPDAPATATLLSLARRACPDA